MVRVGKLLRIPWIDIRLEINDKVLIDRTTLSDIDKELNKPLGLNYKSFIDLMLSSLFFLIFDIPLEFIVGPWSIISWISLFWIFIYEVYALDINWKDALLYQQ